MGQCSSDLRPGHPCRFRYRTTSAAAAHHAIPHPVVSQILRPDLAAFMEDTRVVVRSRRNKLCCADTATFIGGTPLRCADIDFLGQLPQLTSLTFMQSRLETYRLALVATLTQLRHLNLERCPCVDAAGLAQVAKLEQLEHLQITAREGVDATGLSHIAKMKSLQNLDLSDCQDVDAAALAQVSKLTQLQRFRLHECRHVSAAGVREIWKLDQLTHLSICDSGTVDLRPIIKLPYLRQLELTWCGVDAAGLARVATLTELQHLDLMYSGGVDAAGLAEIAKIASLQELCLCGCDGVDVAGLAHLANMTSLRRLDLRYCHGVDTAGLAEVAKMASLQQLDLMFCDGVDAAGIAKLAELKHLRSLDVSDSSLWPEVAKLRRMR